MVADARQCHGQVQGRSGVIVCVSVSIMPDVGVGDGRFEPSLDTDKIMVIVVCVSTTSRGIMEVRIVRKQNNNVISSRITMKPQSHSPWQVTHLLFGSASRPPAFSPRPCVQASCVSASTFFRSWILPA